MKDARLYRGIRCGLSDRYEVERLQEEVVKVRLSSGEWWRED